ncbi:hypothetical protein RYX36_020711 [Vicia faba]
MALSSPKGFLKGITFYVEIVGHQVKVVAGLREWFAQSEERNSHPRIPVMVNMFSTSASSKKSQKTNDISVNSTARSNVAHKNSALLDEYSDEDEDFQIAEPEQEAFQIGQALDEEPDDEIDLSSFSGNLRRDDRDNAQDCWKISDGNDFRVRRKNLFCYDKSKVPAGKHLLVLVTVDWFKDLKRMDHVPTSSHYSMVFYFVTKVLVPGILLQRFVDGDDEFRNNRLNLIPSVPKSSWIIRQSVGSTPCLLGKAVDCNYIRSPKYLEIDVDISSSTVANGVLEYQIKKGGELRSNIIQSYIKQVTN